MIYHETDENVDQENDVDDHESGEIDRSEYRRQIIHRAYLAELPSHHL